MSKNAYRSQNRLEGSLVVSIIGKDKSHKLCESANAMLSLESLCLSSNGKNSVQILSTMTKSCLPLPKNNFIRVSILFLPAKLLKLMSFYLNILNMANDIHFMFNVLHSAFMHRISLNPPRTHVSCLPRLF